MLRRWELRHASGFLGLHVEEEGADGNGRGGQNGYGGGKTSDGKGNRSGDGWGGGGREGNGGSEKSTSTKSQRRDLDMAHEMMGLNSSEVETPSSDGTFSRETSRRMVENMRAGGHSDADISDRMRSMGYSYGDRVEAVGVIDAMPGWGRSISNGLLGAGASMLAGPVGAIGLGAINAAVDMQQDMSFGVAPQDAVSQNLSPAITDAIAGFATRGLMASSPLGDLSKQLGMGVYGLTGGGMFGMAAGQVAASLPGAIAKKAIGAGLRVGVDKLANAAFDQNSSHTTGQSVGRQATDKAAPFHSIYAFDQQHTKGWGSYA